MRVKDIMTSKVETVDQEEIAEAAYNLMRLKKIHHLVVTGMGELVGILSERDLGGRTGRRNGSCRRSSPS